MNTIIAYQSSNSELLFLATNALFFHDGTTVPEWILPLRRRIIVAKWTIKLKSDATTHLHLQSL